MRKYEKKNRLDMMIVSFVLLLFGLLMTGMGAEAKRQEVRTKQGEIQYFSIDLQGYHWDNSGRGQAYFHIKRAFQNQYPHLDVSQYRLCRLVLQAKSSRRGAVRLRVGGDMSPWYSIERRDKRGFFEPRGRLSQKTILTSPSRDGWGPWLLFFRGEVMVDRVVIMVKKRGRSQHHGSAKDFRIPSELGLIFRIKIH